MADPSPRVDSLWVATNLFNAKDSKICTMKPERFEEAKRAFAGGIEAVLPSSAERADWFRKGWVSFYFYPFDIGMKFPFSKLVRDLLVDMQISPAQLMPFSRRILACLEVMEAKHKLGITVDVIKRCYSLKKFYGCFFGFTTKRSLILNVEGANDRQWSKDYFFADKSSLGEAGAFLPERWDPKGDSVGTLLTPLKYPLLWCS